MILSSNLNSKFLRYFFLHISVLTYTISVSGEQIDETLIIINEKIMWQFTRKVNTEHNIISLNNQLRVDMYSFIRKLKKQLRSQLPEGETIITNVCVGQK